MDWQPIETAPKDGTAVLCYWPGIVVDNRPYSFECAVACWSDKDEWHDASTGEQYGDPTHWMHIPEPPK